MPKYIPTEDDMYNTKPCFICGSNCLDDNTDTCSDECKILKEQWQEDWDWLLMRDFE